MSDPVMEFLEGVFAGPLEYTAHAPKGGITIGGKPFAPGEFIPGPDIVKATPEQLKEIHGDKPRFMAAVQGRTNDGGKTFSDEGIGETIGVRRGGKVDLSNENGFAGGVRDVISHQHEMLAQSIAEDVSESLNSFADDEDVGSLRESIGEHVDHFKRQFTANVDHASKVLLDSLKQRIANMHGYLDDHWGGLDEAKFMAAVDKVKGGAIAYADGIQNVADEMEEYDGEFEELNDQVNGVKYATQGMANAMYNAWSDLDDDIDAAVAKADEVREVEDNVWQEEASNPLEELNESGNETAQEDAGYWNGQLAKSANPYRIHWDEDSEEWAIANYEDLEDWPGKEANPVENSRQGDPLEYAHDVSGEARDEGGKWTDGRGTGKKSRFARIKEAQERAAALEAGSGPEINKQELQAHIVDSVRSLLTATSRNHLSMKEALDETKKKYPEITNQQFAEAAKAAVDSGQLKAAVWTMTEHELADRHGVTRDMTFERPTIPGVRPDLIFGLERNPVEKSRDGEPLRYGDAVDDFVASVFALPDDDEADPVKDFVESIFGDPGDEWEDDDEDDEEEVAKVEVEEEDMGRKKSLEYGVCPLCGADCESRERRPNGNDHCQNGHKYPSRHAIHDARHAAQIGRMWDEEEKASKFKNVNKKAE